MVYSAAQTPACRFVLYDDSSSCDGEEGEVVATVDGAPRSFADLQSQSGEVEIYSVHINLVGCAITVYSEPGYLGDVRSGVMGRGRDVCPLLRP